MCFKEDVGNVLIWVKLHGVLMTTFSDDGLNVITTKLGSPLMLDFYTSEMCMKSWGRSSYVRAMIELRVDVELKDTIVVVMPKPINKGFYSVLLVSNMCGNLPGIQVASSSNTPIIDKINKIERQIIEGKLMFVDDDENPLAPMGNMDNESEVEVVFDETANLMASASFEVEVTRVMPDDMFSRKLSEFEVPDGKHKLHDGSVYGLPVNSSNTNKLLKNTTTEMHIVLAYYPEKGKAWEKIKIFFVLNDEVKISNTHSTSSSETYAPYEPSPRIDPFTQPSCLGSTLFIKALRKSDQTYEIIKDKSLATSHKLDEMIEFLKSLPKEGNKDDFSKHEYHEQQDLVFHSKGFKPQETPEESYRKQEYTDQGSTKDSYESNRKFKIAREGFKILRFMFGLDSSKSPDEHIEKNNPSQAPRGIPVGPKVGFKPFKQVYRPVFRKNNANTSGNKNKKAESTKEVSNPKLFDVLNLVENDIDLGTNGGTLNLDSKEANSSGSSFWSVESLSTSTIPIIEKIDKIEKLIIDGKITLVDDEGKPLEKVDYSGDHDSKDEVQPNDNEMASFLASKSVGYDTSQEIPNNIYPICNKLDIKGGGRRDVKEKQHSSANNATKDTVVVSSPAVDEHVVVAGSTKDVDVGKSVNFRTLITPTGNGTDVAVPLESIRAISERAMIELRANIKLKDTIVVDTPKLIREGFYTCNIRVEYEWKPPRASLISLERVGYGTHSLLEQWSETYENAAYEYDRYDDDMYKGHEIPNNIQSICDNLDIKLQGHKKK
uniref:DUF4283 domain-containing protein n=1 Tax=Tanacetum cinerariifolium TaxID=118510 RepID=A0A6L2NXH6_TANCI|nr:hypothetical protein [Tanacetum cinerariifolium]